MDKTLINPMHDPKVLAKRRAKKEVLWKNNKKHNEFMSNWLTPGGETYANVYQSALKAGFSKSYSLNLTSLAPKWISEYIDKLEFTDEHIKQGLQQLAISAPNSRSPDDTRVKSYELLAKMKGMIDNKGHVTNVLVQPILNGSSVNRTVIDSDISGSAVTTPAKATRIDANPSLDQ